MRRDCWYGGEIPIISVAVVCGGFPDVHHRPLNITNPCAVNSNSCAWGTPGAITDFIEMALVRNHTLSSDRRGEIQRIRPRRRQLGCIPRIVLVLLNEDACSLTSAQSRP